MHSCAYVLVTFVAYPIIIHFTFLHRDYSLWIGGNSLLTSLLSTIFLIYFLFLNCLFGCVRKSTVSYILIMSHSLLWRHIVLLTVGVYSNNHRVLYTIGISMMRFQKSVGPSLRPSVSLSVCPFVTLLKKAYSSFIIDSRKIIRISGERVWHPLQENEAIFSKKYIFQKF